MKIAIASGKGGTGKTTLSTNLASLISEEKEVVLVDLDVEEPNSGLFIKGDLVNKEDKYKKIPVWDKEKCILCGNCQEVCNFNAVIKMIDEIIVFDKLCHSCYACSELCPQSALPMKPQKIGVLKEYKSSKLVFVESELEIGQEQAVPLIKQTQSYVDEKFSNNHLKIYDAPPGTSCPIIEATKETDFVILVTEPTPFGLHDLKLSVETMNKLNKKFGVVINRYGIGNEEVEKFCAMRKIPIIAKIPNFRAAAELYSQGKMLYKEIGIIKKHIESIVNYLSHLKQNR